MPKIEIIQFNVKIIDAIVMRLKPKYIGFLLNRYNPLYFNVVLSSGSPSLVDFPRL